MQCLRLLSLSGGRICYCGPCVRNFNTRSVCIVDFRKLASGQVALVGCEQNMNPIFPIHLCPLLGRAYSWSMKNTAAK